MLILGLGQHVLHALHFLGLLINFKLYSGLLPVFIISCLASSTAIDLLSHCHWKSFAHCQSINQSTLFNVEYNTVDDSRMNQSNV